jgi:TolB-like protein
MSAKGTSYWRRVVASSAVYAAGGWAVVEALTTVVDRFGLPAWLGTLVTALYVAGLPVTAFLVWRTAGEERRLTVSSFSGAVCLLIAGTAVVFWITRPAPPAPQHLVAVLPCEFSGSVDRAYRAEGLAEDVHARLSRVEAVKISSWNSSLFVRDKGLGTGEIVDLLKTDRLVRCRMRSESERIEVSAELIDPANDQVLWTRDYDFVAADLGTVVTELTGALLEVLGTPIQAAERERVNNLGTFSPEAYDLYLQARSASSWTSQGRSASDERDTDRLAVADALVGQALQIDPNFAEALVLQADILMERVLSRGFENMDELKERLYEARSLSQRALDADPGVLDARLILAGVCGLLGEYWNEPCPEGESERLEREECEIRGDTAEGWACRSRILPEPDNIGALQRWLELEPTSVDANMQHMGMLMSRGAPITDVLGVFNTLQALAPDDKRPYGLVSNNLRRKGRLDEVLAWRWGAFGGRMPDGEPWLLARLATDYMNLRLDDLAEKPGVLTVEARPASAVHFMPFLWKRLGEAEKAAALLERQVEQVGGRPGNEIGLTNAATWFAVALGRYDRAKELYDEALSRRGLDDLCDRSEDCIADEALLLAQIERALGDEDNANVWLERAEEAMSNAWKQQPVGQPQPGPSLLDARFLIMQGRKMEAVEALRAIVFRWDVDDGGDLTLPIYLLESGTPFDSLRDMPEFQQLIEDYKAALEPMRQRVLEAERTGDWEALRRRTYQRAEESAGTAREAPEFGAATPSRTGG